MLGDFIRKYNVRDELFGEQNSTGISFFLSRHFLTFHRNAVASKCGFEVFGPQRKVTNSAAHIKEYIEGTIERLGFTPDLYYLHRIDPSMYEEYPKHQSSILTL